MVERVGTSFRFVVAAVVLCALLAIAAALVVVARGRAFEGMLVVFATVLLLRWYWKATARTRALARHGFHVGRRIGTHWVYEELHDGVVVALELPLAYVGRGEYDIHVPAESLWRSTMPEWARERREEIAARLGAVFKRSQIHFDADQPQAP